jgi:hypothetical protein
LFLSFCFEPLYYSLSSELQLVLHSVVSVFGIRGAALAHVPRTRTEAASRFCRHGSWGTGKSIKLAPDVIWDLLQDARETNNTITVVLSVRHKVAGPSQACSSGRNGRSLLCAVCIRL